MLTLKAEKRNISGKPPQVLRKEGFLPSVVYGPNFKNESIQVSLSDFEKAYRQAGETSLVELSVDSKKVNVLIYDIARDPRTLKPVHADFYAVDMKKEIHAQVPLVFVGESLAVKSEGGILVKVMQELEIEALPENLPHEITVSIDVLAAIGDRLLVSSLHIPKGVKMKANPDEIVAIVEAPRKEEEVQAVAAPVAEEGVVEVKTEREVKTAEKEAKKLEEETLEK